MSTNQTSHKTVWDQRLEALDSFVAREGTALVPAKHVERAGNNTPVGLGSWVSYVRTRYRNGSLPQSRIAELEAYEGWDWGPLRPGPKPDRSRDYEIKQMRNDNKSLQEIGDVYGLSRQRIHQIVSA